jgi:uncharacterized protein (DUF4415 family)
MARRRNIYKPGTGSYDAARAAELRRLARLAQANIKRAKKPEAIRKTKRRAAAIERDLAKVTARQQARARLSEADRAKFNRRGVGWQNRALSDYSQEHPDYHDPVLRLLLSFPNAPPPNPDRDPRLDPFARYGESRNAMWNAYYRALARNRRSRRLREVRRMQEAA